MLDKMKNPTAWQQPQDQAEPRTTVEAFAAADDSNIRPEHSAAMTLGMLSGGLSPNSAALFNTSSMGQIDMTMDESTGLTPNYGMDPNSFSVPTSFPFFGAAPGNVELPTNLDWEAWDAYIQNGGGVDPAMQYFPPGVDPSQNQGSSSSGLGGSSSVFMGANTPGK